MPTEETVQLIGKAMKYGLQNGLYKAVEVLPKIVPKLGVDKAAKENTEQDFRMVFKEFEEAKQMVKKLQSEI